MAALSVVRSFHGSHSSIQDLKTRNCPRILILLSCQRGEPTDTSSSKEKKESKQDKQLVRQIFGAVENFGKGLKDSLSPKQKGDWKDVMLMSLSFAVYVYMSQKIADRCCDDLVSSLDFSGYFLSNQRFVLVPENGMRISMEHEH
ncbi:hypothetical protein DKX38_013993 [Salix brachista]|uniref:Uncharacterized protein n=1 Tax=Salix brachista TaxID=2182728 RepID=A0A5N5LE25_9ROSI|nr:hypothetical protein DKX38_013993 [Salix brachista]